MRKTIDCPNCGTEAPAGQKFCRACGVSLKRYGQLLDGSPSNIEDKDVTSARRRLCRIESAMKIGRYTIVLALWLGVAILIARAGVDLINENGNIGGGVVLLVLAAGLIAAEGLLIYYASLHAKVSARQPTQPADPSTYLSAATTNKLLPKGQPGIPMSVTEQTTARLEERIKLRSSDR
jgi:hypothetical protein